jgi:hypothetical protein
VFSTSNTPIGVTHNLVHANYIDMAYESTEFAPAPVNCYISAIPSWILQMGRQHQNRASRSKKRISLSFPFRLTHFKLSLPSFPLRRG